MSTYYMATAREPGLSNAGTDTGGTPPYYEGKTPVLPSETSDESGNILYYLLAFLGGVAVASFISK